MPRGTVKAYRYCRLVLKSSLLDLVNIVRSLLIIVTPILSISLAILKKCRIY